MIAMTPTRPRRRAPALLLTAFVLVAATGPLAAQADVDAVFERGVEAYRRGAYEEADLQWRSLLGEELTPAARARLYYDLGNAAWRRDEPRQAVGWYSSALRLSPRDAAAWHNLELARAASDLEPADRGDLRSTARRVVSSLRPGEARWLALVGLLPLAVMLVGEALLGGKHWRRGALLALALAGVLALPWGWHLTRRGADPLLVIGGPRVTLRSEPRPSLPAIGEVSPGDEVERLDALSGWVRIETPDGRRGWVAEDAVFALPLP